MNDIEFKIFYNGSEWVVHQLGDTVDLWLAAGITPVGAMINAEIALRKRPR